MLGNVIFGEACSNEKMITVIAALAAIAGIAITVVCLPQDR